MCEVMPEKNDWSKNESSTCWRDYTFGLQTNPPAEIWLSKLVSPSAWLSAVASRRKGVTKLKDIWGIMSVEEQSCNGKKGPPCVIIVFAQSDEVYQTVGCWVYMH